MTATDEKLIEELRAKANQSVRYSARYTTPAKVKDHVCWRAADRLAVLQAPADPTPASAIMHRPGMSRDDLAACCAANAAAMHAGNLRDLLEDAASALHATEGMGELLKDPAAVHLNMLRGGIAKLTAAQVGHIYRSDEARAVIAEIMRQNPDITYFTRAEQLTDGALTLTEAVAAMRAVPSDLHEGSLQELLDDRARDGEPAAPKPDGA